ncbi:MAG: hypothetical protein NC918_07980, partial [Candidatus Omnitrophica bacterium]|nr:hypothetical protein [Candidatus Omnitrophota bacterium]
NLDFMEGKKLFEEWQNAVSKYDNLANIFFEKDPSLFKKFVENKASDSGIKINSLTITQKDEERFLVVNLNLSVLSFYKDLLKFLQSLEEKIIIVERMNIKKSTSRVLQSEIVLKSFVLKDL